MPAAGMAESELAAVDLSQAEEVAGLNGRTVRQMIRQTNHCEWSEEEDLFCGDSWHRRCWIVGVTGNHRSLGGLYVFPVTPPQCFQRRPKRMRTAIDI